MSNKSRHRPETINAYADFIDLHNGKAIELYIELEKSRMNQNVKPWVAAGVAVKHGRYKYLIKSDNPRRDAILVLKTRSKISREKAGMRTLPPELFDEPVIEHPKPKPAAPIAQPRKVISILWGLVRIES